MGEGPKLVMLASDEPSGADPFVARDTELDTLARWWTDARGGSTPWLGLVAGESGVGAVNGREPFPELELRSVRADDCQAVVSLFQRLSPRSL